MGQKEPTKVSPLGIIKMKLTHSTSIKVRDYPKIEIYYIYIKSIRIVNIQRMSAQCSLIHNIYLQSEILKLKFYNF